MTTFIAEMLSSVLVEGPKALAKVLGSGWDLSGYDGLDSKAFEFIVQYYRDYHEVPPISLVKNECGFEVPTYRAPVEFWIDKMREAKLRSLYQERLEEMIRCNSDGDIETGMTLMSRAVKDLRSLQRTVQPVVSLPAMAEQVIAHHDKIAGGWRGVETPWKSLNEMTFGFGPEDFVLFCARQGVGKCVHADSEIYDPETGIPWRIEDLHIADNIVGTFSWSKEEGIHWRKITAKIDTGKKKCIKFTLKSGREITVTPEHPLLTPRGWVKAEDVHMCETIGTPARLPFPEIPRFLSTDQLFMIALFVSGRMVWDAKGERFVVRLGNLDALVELQSAVRKFSRHNLRSLGKGDYSIIAKTPLTRDKPSLKEFLIGHQLLGESPRLPKAIFQLDSVQLSSFLGLLFYFAGVITARKVELSLQPDCAGYLRDVQSLLLRFGVYSFQRKDREATGDYDVLAITPKSWRLFLTKLHLPRQLRRRVDRDGAQAKSDVNIGVLRLSVEQSAECLKDFREAWAEKGIPFDKLMELAGYRSDWSPEFLVNVQQRLRCEFMRVICYYLGEAHAFSLKWGWLATSEIFWDEVVVTEKLPPQKIYDLTVEPTHCFIANDIIVHNTWMLVILADWAWRHGKRVLIASTEMGQLRMALRWFAVHEKLPPDALRKGRLFNARESVASSATSMKEMEGLYMVGGGNYRTTFDTVESAVDEVEPDIILLDGAYLMSDNKGKGGKKDDRFSQAAGAFEGCKELNLRMHTPVVVTTQFNRQAKRNSLANAEVENIAMSDTAGWAADWIFAQQQTDEMKDALEMIIKPLKTREGSGREFMIRWDIDGGNFEEIEHTRREAAQGKPQNNTMAAELGLAGAKPSSVDNKTPLSRRVTSVVPPEEDKSPPKKARIHTKTPVLAEDPIDADISSLPGFEAPGDDFPLAGGPPSREPGEDDGVPF